MKKTIKIRYYKQPYKDPKNSGSCAAYAILNAAKFYLSKKTPRIIPKLNKTLGTGKIAYGTSRTSFDKNIHKYLTCTRYSNPTISFLKKALDSNKCVILDYFHKDRRSGHFVTIVGYDNRHFLTKNDSRVYSVHKKRTIATIQARLKRSGRYRYPKTVKPWVWVISGTKI
jgi:hypothetical protein